MDWVLGLLLVAVAVMGVAYAKGTYLSYRTGAGMFKNSDDNLDEKEDFVDKEYYDENKGFFK